MKIKFLIGLVIIVIIGLYIVNKNNIFLTFNHPAEQESTKDSISETINQDTDGFPKVETVNGVKVPNNETNSKNIVNYTDTGFNPSSLEIKIGQTVRFVNQSSHGMWVGSGPHPTHTAYPEFDTKKNIPIGEVYEFTFTKIGAWKYHNHTKSGMYGTVIVK